MTVADFVMTMQTKMRLFQIILLRHNKMNVFIIDTSMHSQDAWFYDDLLVT